MNIKEKIIEIWKPTLLLLVVIISTVVVFLLCYHYDNKYTIKGPQPMKGILMLDEQNLERYPVIYLIRDWEIYRGKLLVPEDFANNPPRPKELVFIGQY